MNKLIALFLYPPWGKPPRKILFKAGSREVHGEVVSDDGATYEVETYVGIRWFLFVPFVRHRNTRLEYDDASIVSVDPPREEPDDNRGWLPNLERE